MKGAFRDLLGTLFHRFQIGLRGPMLRAQNGAIEVRSSDDSDFAPLRAALVEIFGDDIVINAGAAGTDDDRKLTLRRGDGQEQDLTIVLPTGSPEVGQAMAVASFDGSVVVMHWGAAAGQVENVVDLDSEQVITGHKTLHEPAFIGIDAGFADESVQLLRSRPGQYGIDIEDWGAGAGWYVSGSSIRHAPSLEGSGGVLGQEIYDVPPGTYLLQLTIWCTAGELYLSVSGNLDPNLSQPPNTINGYVTISLVLLLDGYASIWLYPNDQNCVAQIISMSLVPYSIDSKAAQFGTAGQDAARMAISLQAGNVVIGHNSGRCLRQGFSSGTMIIGNQSMISTVDPSDVVIIGSDVMTRAVSARSCVIIGSRNLTYMPAEMENVTIVGSNVGGMATKGNNWVVIGGNVYASMEVTSEDVVAIGGVVTESGCTAIGFGAQASHRGAVAIGKETYSNREDSVAIGDRDLEVGAPGRGIILTSPGGMQYRLTIGDDGQVTTEVL